MIRRYAHLAANYLTEHARKIDVILGANDTNTTQGENQVPTGFEYTSHSYVLYE